MGVVVTKGDFVGKYGIKQTKPMLNGTDVALGLDNFIQEREEGILIDLMGADLFLAFKANPSDPVYTPLYGLGLKIMLIKFIYFDYYRTEATNTSTGQAKNTGETFTGAKSSTLYYNVILHNEAIKVYNVISDYIVNNTSVYTQFKSNVSKKKSIFL